VPEQLRHAQRLESVGRLAARRARLQQPAQVILGYCGLLRRRGARKVVTRSRRSARRPRAAPSSHSSSSPSAAARR
jgi:hypothetical protein